LRYTLRYTLRDTLLYRLGSSCNSGCYKFSLYIVIILFINEKMLSTDGTCIISNEHVIHSIDIGNPHLHIVFQMYRRMFSFGTRMVGVFHRDDTIVTSGSLNNVEVIV